MKQTFDREYERLKEAWATSDAVQWTGEGSGRAADVAERAIRNTWIVRMLLEEGNEIKDIAVFVESKRVAALGCDLVFKTLRDLGIPMLQHNKECVTLVNGKDVGFYPIDSRMTRGTGAQRVIIRDVEGVCDIRKFLRETWIPIHALIPVKTVVYTIRGNTTAAAEEDINRATVAPIDFSDF